MTKEKEISEVAKENFDRWNEALLSKEPKKVAEIYCENGILIPTLSGKMRKGRVEIEDYFVHFLAKNPKGILTNVEVQELGDGLYNHVGDYNFEVDDSENPNQRVTVSARFSYTWKKESDNQWRIIHHHSSLNPDKK